MTTSLGSSGAVTGGVGDGFAGGDGLLPMTGFGPGSLIIALIGGILTLCGAITHRFGRRSTRVVP